MTDPVATSRAAVGMGAIAAASRVVGFVRVLVVAAVLGTTYLGNAFQAANSFSNVLFELLAAGALSAVLVPAFVGLLDVGDDEGAEAVAGGVLGTAVVGLGTLALAGVLLAPWLARLLTLGVPTDVVAEQRELVTFLLRWFIPQIVLYAAGAVATGVLYAQRRFAITAAAPIGNTVVMVIALLVFRSMVGSAPGLDLSNSQRWMLVVAGSGGVVAFVGTLLGTLERTGFRLRPRLARGDARVRAVLVHSGWGVVLHTGAGLLLGGSIIAGSAVEGGVVAYQVAFVFFLAPYAVLAQPIHTAILPELVNEGRGADLDAFRTSIRWSLERIALFALPVSAAMVALALPAMRAVSFGEVSAEGPGLLAAALAALAVGLFPYGAFLLLARAYYALGDSRTPGVVSLVSAVTGVIVMVVGAVGTSGAARVAFLGAGHSVAYAVGALILLKGLHRRTGGSLLPVALVPMVVVCGVTGMVAWLAGRLALSHPAGRLADIVGLVVIAGLGAVVVLATYQATGLLRALTSRQSVTSGVAPPEVLP